MLFSCICGGVLELGVPLLFSLIMMVLIKLRIITHTRYGPINFPPCKCCTHDEGGHRANRPLLARLVARLRHR